MLQQALHYRVSNYVLKPAKYHVLLDVFVKLREELEAGNVEKERSAAEDLQGSDESFIIRQIKDYVTSHYQNASLEQAARLVHMNANYLSFFFKQKTGRNFSDYVIQHKMEVAAGLLQDMSFKTYTVSEMVGYSNAKNFTRTFKSYYGKTPSEYRNGPAAP